MCISKINLWRTEIFIYWSLLFVSFSDSIFPYLLVFSTHWACSKSCKLINMYAFLFEFLFFCDWDNNYLIWVFLVIVSRPAVLRDYSKLSAQELLLTVFRRPCGCARDWTQGSHVQSRHFSPLRYLYNPCSTSFGGFGFG